MTFHGHAPRSPEKVHVLLARAAVVRAGRAHSESSFTFIRWKWWPHRFSTGRRRHELIRRTPFFLFLFSPPTLHSDIVSTRHFVLLEPFASRLVSVPPLLFSLLLQPVGTTILCPSSLPLFIFSFSFSSPFLLLPHLSIFFSFSFTSVAACASSTQDALVIKRFFFLRWFKSFINWLA